jgi:hypothetical protein
MHYIEKEITPREVQMFWTFMRLIVHTTLNVNSHQVALEYSHELGHKSLQVEDMLASDVDPMLVESGPFDHLCLECIIDAFNKTESQQLSRSSALREAIGNIQLSGLPSRSLLPECNG